MSMIDAIASFAWGPIMITALFATGVVLTIGTRIVRYRRLGSFLDGSRLTTAAYGAQLPGFGIFVVTPGLIFFAFSTTLTSYFYGFKSLEYIAGRTCFCRGRNAAPRRP